MMPRESTQQGFTLFEVLVALILLGMVSTMIYSILRVGINFADKGERYILDMAREQGFLSILQRQVSSAYYDSKTKDVLIEADDDMLKLVTRTSLLYQNAGIVLAVYRYDMSTNTIYYAEKRDYYNQDYAEDYVPDFDDMYVLLTDVTKFVVSYDPDAGMVAVDYDDNVYDIIPRCKEISAEVIR